MTLPDPVPRALVTVLNELLDGASWDAGWVLNPGDPGILRSLDLLPAEAASAAPADGGSSIAAHVDHLRYGLELLNRWAGGEEPFAEANFGASWRRVVVDEEEWAARRQALRREAYAWREAIEQRVDASREDLTTIVASVVHLGVSPGGDSPDRSTHRRSAGGPLNSRSSAHPEPEIWNAERGTRNLDVEPEPVLRGRLVRGSAGKRGYESRFEQLRPHHVDGGTPRIMQPRMKYVF